MIQKTYSSQQDPVYFPNSRKLNCFCAGAPIHYPLKASGDLIKDNSIILHYILGSSLPMALIKGITLGSQGIQESSIADLPKFFRYVKTLKLLRSYSTFKEKERGKESMTLCWTSEKVNYPLVGS
jgi:hypothetical protein